MNSRPLPPHTPQSFEPPQYGQLFTPLRPVPLQSSHSPLPPHCVHSSVAISETWSPYRRTTSMPATHTCERSSAWNHRSSSLVSHALRLSCEPRSPHCHRWLPPVAYFRPSMCSLTVTPLWPVRRSPSLTPFAIMPRLAAESSLFERHPSKARSLGTCPGPLRWCCLRQSRNSRGSSVSPTALMVRLRWIKPLIMTSHQTSRLLPGSAASCSSVQTERFSPPAPSLG